MFRSRLPQTFFGLRPESRPLIHEEIFSVCYYGNGGFTHDQVYTMPIYLRKFYLQMIKKVIEQSKKQEDVPPHAKFKFGKKNTV